MTTNQEALNIIIDRLDYRNDENNAVDSHLAPAVRKESLRLKTSAHISLNKAMLGFAIVFIQPVGISPGPNVNVSFQYKKDGVAFHSGDQSTTLPYDDNLGPAMVEAFYAALVKAIG